MVELTRGHGTVLWLDPAIGRPWTGDLRWPIGRAEPFGAGLWLQTPCCGGRLLWARNADHLDYLSAFIAADLRDTSGTGPVGTMTSRLPAWLIDAKHRDEVLRHLERLRSANPSSASR